MREREKQGRGGSEGGGMVGVVREKGIGGGRSRGEGGGRRGIGWRRGEGKAGERGDKGDRAGKLKKKEEWGRWRNGE